MSSRVSKDRQKNRNYGTAKLFSVSPGVQWQISAIQITHRKILRTSLYPKGPMDAEMVVGRCRNMKEEKATPLTSKRAISSLVRALWGVSLVFS
jgi:hypothetical protein